MLIREIENFLRQHRMTPTRFGRNALGDPKFVGQLRAGRELRPATVARVRAYLQSQPEPQL